MLFPAMTGLGEPELVTVKSAVVARPTIVVTEAVLLLSVGSRVPDVIEAVSVICVWLVVPALT